MKLHRRHVVAGTVGVLVLGILTPGAQASPAVGSLSVTTYVIAQLNHPVQLKSDGVRLRIKAATDVRVQTLTFARGTRTGWHHHPGPVIVAVQSGAVTVWTKDCSTTTYGPAEAAGSVFTEGGNDAGEVTSAGGATVYATFIAPHADPPVFRLEDPVISCPLPVAGHQDEGDHSE